MTLSPLVVVPAFNEERSIERVIWEIRNCGLDLIVVDDGSTDNTRHIALRAGVRVLQVPLNRGVGAALRCGFRWAVENGYHSVVQVDSDGQHDSRFIANLIKAAEESGADMVIGSRFSSRGNAFGVSRGKRLVMKFMASSVSRLAGRRLTDVTSGFRLIKNPLLSHISRSLPDYYLGDTFELAYAAAARGYQIVEVPVDIRLRQHGESSASRREAVSMIFKTLIVTLMTLHFEIPEKGSGGGEGAQSGCAAYS